MIFVFVILSVFSCRHDANPSGPVATNTPTPIASYTDLASVPGGTFVQTDASDTTNAFTSTVSEFKMGKYEVTYDLWYMVCQWAIANGYTFQLLGAEGFNGTVGAPPTAARYVPAVFMGWRDVIVWCNAYSQKTGLTPVYCLDAGFKNPIKSSIDAAYSNITDPTAGGIDNPYVNWSANGYRLPTESEYQYTASYINGSIWTPYNYASGATAAYTNEAATELVGWFNANTGVSLTEANVGILAPNALGIYNMSANAWGWCWDWYGPYPTTAQTNYRGIASVNPADFPGRVFKGGCYAEIAYNLQVGIRNFSASYGYSRDRGFRVARSN